MLWIQFAIWLDLALVGIDWAFHPRALPLGGSAGVQLGTLLVIAVCISEGLRFTRELRREIFKQRISGSSIESGASKVDLTPSYVGPERRVSTDKRPWVGGRRASDRVAMAT